MALSMSWTPDLADAHWMVIVLCEVPMSMLKRIANLSLIDRPPLNRNGWVSYHEILS